MADLKQSKSDGSRKRERDRQTDEGRERERERERERSELYYTTTEILGNSLILQSVLAKLHREHIIKIINDTFQTHTI